MTKINEEFVAYIVAIKRNEKTVYKPFLAKPIFMEDDNDSVLNVVASEKKYDELKDAQTAVEKIEIKETIKKYKNPIQSSFCGISWLSELEKSTD